jgi:hypothetical protein
MVFIKNEFEYQDLAFVAFGIALISVAITKLFYTENTPEALAKYKGVRYLYALGSASFALMCAIMAYDSYGLNPRTFVGVIGAIFFGASCPIILFKDHEKVYEKHYARKDISHNEKLEQE